MDPAPQDQWQIVTYTPQIPSPVALPGAISLCPRPELLVPARLLPLAPPERYFAPRSLLIQIDDATTRSLLQFMARGGPIPSPEEEFKRQEAISQLKQIVLDWAKNVALRHGLPMDQRAITSATILTFGSYGLGVHGSESDIDALCVGPLYATMEGDFFVVLCNMLQNRPEVSDIHSVKNAKVPLMRFKFNGISIDLPYAQLPFLSVSDENVDLFDPSMVHLIDEISWRSLSGVRVNACLLQLVPNVENFQSMLRCVKFWAKRRGVYSHLHGFLGGIHLAILAAFVCQRYPNAGVSALISIFFGTFYHWRWPTPVILQGGSIPSGNIIDGRSFMPIMMPCSPCDWCSSNITRSTFNKIMTELLRGYKITQWQERAKPNFEWSHLFDPFPYTKVHKRFVRIFLGAPTMNELQDWAGLVKSRIRGLLLKIEEVQGYCDPNPTEFVDNDVAEPNRVLYWGLSPHWNGFVDIDFIKEEFMRSIGNGDQGSGFRLELSIVDSSQVPKNAELDCLSGVDLRAHWRISDPSQPRLSPVCYQLVPYYIPLYVAPDGSQYPMG